jgi:hypothetical protein
LRRLQHDVAEQERDFTCERTAQRTLAEYGRLLAARRGAGEAGAG